MRYRRFKTSSGQFLDALMTSEGEFSTSAESHKADHETGYGVAPLTVVEGDSDPWDGVSVLLKAPPRLQPPDWSGLRNAVLQMPQLGATPGARLSAANALFKAYPTALLASDPATADSVTLRATVDLMLAEAAIDATKHAAFVALMATYNIPNPA